MAVLLFHPSHLFAHRYPGRRQFGPSQRRRQDQTPRSIAILDSRFCASRTRSSSLVHTRIPAHPRSPTTRLGSTRLQSTWGDLTRPISSHPIPIPPPPPPPPSSRRRTEPTVPPTLTATPTPHHLVNTKLCPPAIFLHSTIALHQPAGRIRTLACRPLSVDINSLLGTPSTSHSLIPSAFPPFDRKAVRHSVGQSVHQPVTHHG